ncbi:serine hydrolase domain-containing protein [Nocardioides sp.]|uniref:serine hydrolase domain-containing protein n=1 Tax=Nocardioides sp. TaxID=35761 RepID=UPI00356745AD
MLRVLVVLTLALGTSLHGGASGDSIEDFIASEMPACGAPGMSYAVVSDGAITSSGAYGVLRAGEEREVTPDTPFLIGSISKSFTAVAVMQLVEAGEVDLDGETARYLDAFSGRSAGEITIRELLSHTSGFSTLQGNETSRSDELAREVDSFAGVDPAHTPGERWEYSNLNYQILGRVIEVVSGQDYQAYVTTNILEPLGMEHSFVSDGEIHDSMATGHRPWFWTKRPLAENRPERATAPQGGIVASANDLARYLQVMMNGEDDVLSAEGKALMMRPANAVSPDYGLGWFLDSAEGSVWHDGASPGFETLAQMLPAERKAVVVLVNAGSGLGFAETTEVRVGVAARALVLDYSGEGSRLPQKVLFISLLLLPLIYLFSMLWAWRHRAELRAKTGVFGRFSLWFPLLTTSVAAWVILRLVPSQFGAPIGTIALFAPDLGLALIATAVTGVLWAGFRLGIGLRTSS